MQQVQLYPTSVIKNNYVSQIIEEKVKIENKNEENTYNALQLSLSIMKKFFIPKISSNPKDIKKNIKIAQQLQLNCNKACKSHNKKIESQSYAADLACDSRNFCKLSIPFNGKNVEPTLEGVKRGVQNFKKKFNTVLECKNTINGEICKINLKLAKKRNFFSHYKSNQPNNTIKNEKKVQNSSSKRNYTLLCKTKKNVSILQNTIKRGNIVIPSNDFNTLSFNEYNKQYIGNGCIIGYGTDVYNNINTPKIFNNQYECTSISSKNFQKEWQNFGCPMIGFVKKFEIERLKSLQNKITNIQDLINIVSTPKIYILGINPHTNVNNYIVKSTTKYNLNNLKEHDTFVNAIKQKQLPLTQPTPSLAYQSISTPIYENKK